MSSEAGPASAEEGRIRRLWRFLFSGSLAFATDAAVLAAGVHGLGQDPRVARIAAIAVAIVVAWLCHRRFTFEVATAPTLAEFVKFAMTAWMVSAVNYSLFVLILTLRPQTWPQFALVVATIVATVLSYLSMRYGVFRHT